MSFQEANKLINDLIVEADKLGALGALLGGVSGEIEVHAKAREKYAAVQRAIAPDLFDGIAQEEAVALRATISARLRQALKLVEAPDQPPVWNHDDPVVLQTQGRSSRVVTRLISEFAEKEKALSGLLEGAAHFLDVGCGTGWISISMAERWPLLKADGLDIHAPALELANQNVRAAGLVGRVAVRNQSIADLDETDRYAAAFIPFIFIPETVLDVAVPALNRAVQQNGWLFIGCYREPAGELGRALWDLRTAMSGGRVWSEDEISDYIGRHGFSFVEDIGEGTGINLYAAKKV